MSGINTTPNNNNPHRQPPTPSSTLCIWQQNMNKSRNAQQHMLCNLDPKQYDITLIQEPVINIINLTMANPKWNVVYPSTHNKDRATRTRSVILINKAVSKDSWCAVPIESPDITTIELSGTFGRIRICNVYNDNTHNNTLTMLENHFTFVNAHERNLPGGLLLMGDFNCHHPMWDETRNQHLFTAANLRAAQPLLELLVLYDLVMVLPEGTPMLEANVTGNHTHPDNIFCISHLMETITKCNIQPELHPTGTDHYPIITELNLNPERTNPPSRRNYRATNWEEFEKFIIGKLNSLPPPREINSIPHLEQKMNEVTQAILTMVDNIVPASKLSPYMKQWWTPELGTQNKNVKKLARTAYTKRQQCAHPIHAQLKEARNCLSTDIQKAKEEHWIEYLEDIETSNV
jgi:exonuclease III